MLLDLIYDLPFKLFGHRRRPMSQQRGRELMRMRISYFDFKGFNNNLAYA